MEFEFDTDKSLSDKEKHGIDFAEAQELWDDSNRLVIPARTEDESRYVLIAKLADICWSAIFTERNGKTRIISVRRSRAEEVKLYEG
jgi:uncharacterized DUF497 family protein